MTTLNLYQGMILTAMTGKTGEWLVFDQRRQRWVLKPTDEEVGSYMVELLARAGLIRLSPNGAAARITKLGIAALDAARAVEAVAEVA